MPGFVRAVKHESKLRLALMGPSGVGKTFTALTIACALADGRPVAVVDTERGSASKYADQFAFDVLELDDFHPTRYVQAIKDAVAVGYAVIVIDSLSHAWYGTNGMLELVAKQGKTFDAWGRVKPIENALLDALTGSPIHVIATMRSKVAYEVDKDEKTGKMVPHKVGTAAIQREGIEYEFDIAGEMDQNNTLTVSKSRCPALAGAVIAKPGAEVAGVLRTWLAGTPATDGATRPSTSPHTVPASKTTGDMQDRFDDDRNNDSDNELQFDVVDTSTESTPTPPATPAIPAAPAGTTFKDLRLRALHAGVRTLADWEQVCRDQAGTSDAKRMTADGKAALVAYVESLERTQDAQTDLAALGTGHGRA